jgi:hypothetical protein
MPFSLHIENKLLTSFMTIDVDTDNLATVVFHFCTAWLLLPPSHIVLFERKYLLAVTL